MHVLDWSNVLLLLAVLSAMALRTARYAQSVSGFAEVRGIGQLGVDGVPVNAIERFRPTWDGDDHLHLQTTWHRHNHPHLLQPSVWTILTMFLLQLVSRVFLCLTWAVPPISMF